MVHLLGDRKNSAVINAEILEFIAQTTFQSLLLKVKKDYLNTYRENITLENMVKKRTMDKNKSTYIK